MGTVVPPQDLPPSVECGARTWWTEKQVWEACEQDALDRGVEFRQNRASNVCVVYNHIRKWSAIGGHHTYTTRQIARDIYPHVADDPDAWRKIRKSVQRWLRVLERQKIVASCELVSRRGKGKTLGFRISLLEAPGDTVTASGIQGQCEGSSARESAPRGSREPSEAARVRRWCPRAGRGSRVRSPIRTDAPRGPLRGPKENLASCARAGPAERPSVDAIERHGRAETDVAALDSELTAALGGVALQTLLRAEETLHAAVGTTERLTNLPTIRRLLWTLERLDRYGNHGQGEPGAGLSVLDRQIHGALETAAVNATPAPRHLAYFIPGLHEEGRRWKHTHAPTIKRTRKEHQAMKLAQQLEGEITNLQGLLDRPMAPEVKVALEDQIDIKREELNTSPRFNYRRQENNGALVNPLWRDAFTRGECQSPGPWR